MPGAPSSVHASLLVLFFSQLLFPSRHVPREIRSHPETGNTFVDAVMPSIQWGGRPPTVASAPTAPDWPRRVRPGWAETGMVEDLGIEPLGKQAGGTAGGMVSFRSVGASRGWVAEIA